MLNGIASLLIANGYTEASLVGAGALKGDKGDKGEPGVSMKAVEINSEDHLIVTMTNNKKLDAGVLPSDPVEVSKAAGNTLTKLPDGLFSSGSEAPFSSVDDSFSVSESAQLQMNFETSDIDYNNF